MALTARTIADAIRAHARSATEVLVCGGGAHNGDADARARGSSRPRGVGDDGGDGVPVEQVEALAFAWLAREALAGRPGNLPAVTGARGPRVLGAIYPRSARNKNGRRAAPVACVRLSFRSSRTTSRSRRSSSRSDS